MNTIPLFKVSTNVEGALENIKGVLESGYVGQGKWCERLEATAAAVLGHKHLLYLNSGTSSLQLALHMAGIGPGTEVISTPITCLATNAAIVACGGKIVWADVDPETGNISVDDVCRKVTQHTRAVMAVDWAGRVCNFAELRRRLRGLTLIEDAAHAFMADAPERGDFICYSLQAIKHTNSADGGLLACPSPATYERAKLLRWFGLDRTRSDAMRCYQPVNELGWKFQGNDVLAALGVANMAGVDNRVAAHRQNALWYSMRLRNVPYVRLPPDDPGSSWWLYTVRVANPAAFENFMGTQGVVVSQVHARNDLYRCLDRYRVHRLCGVDAFSAHHVSIPVGWWLNEGDREMVARAVEAWSQQPQAAWSME